MRQHPRLARPRPGQDLHVRSLPIIGHDVLLDLVAKLLDDCILGLAGGQVHGRLIGRTKDGLNTKLHEICDSRGCLFNLFVTAGQVGDDIGGRVLLSSLPDAGWLPGGRGSDAGWFRDALKDKGIRACTPDRKQRRKPVKYGKCRYKRRNRIMFGRLKDWRRMATRYDRCPKVFFSAIALAALVTYWM